MTDPIDAVRSRYSTLSNDELQNVAVTGGLSDEARERLSLELHRRGIEDVSKYRAHLRRTEQDHLRNKQKVLESREKSIPPCGQMGYSVSFLGVLAGLFALYVQRDEKNGIGIIVASVILLPLVWIISQVRRSARKSLCRFSRSQPSHGCGSPESSSALQQVLEVAVVVERGCFLHELQNPEHAVAAVAVHLAELHGNA